ncbi:Uncharacterised protein [Mycobacteroides abscessus]|nr:Uncharacterised protein [Mycobacteroides abscessus]
MTARADRSENRITRSPGPTPLCPSWIAKRSAASSSSRYVRLLPPKVSATASGSADTCAVNRSGIDTGLAAGTVRTALLPSSARSASSSLTRESNDESRRSGSAAISERRRCSRTARFGTPNLAKGSPSPDELKTN